MASLTEREIKEYVQKAEAGDVQAMGILAGIPKKLPDGKVDPTHAPRFPEWTERAIAAGDKLLDLSVRHIAAIRAGKSNEYEQATLEEWIQALEATALNGREDSALALAKAYLKPSDRGWPESKRSLEKSMHWFRVAAGLGSRTALIYLCDMNYNGLRHFGGEGAPDYSEAAKWCVQAAHVGCDEGGALHLRTMYEKGLGVPRNLAEALYWRQVARDRDDTNTRRARELTNR